MSIWTRSSSAFMHNKRNGESGVGSSSLGSGENARLMIFVPAARQETVVRPLSYNFNNSFIDQLHEKINESRYNVSGGRAYRNHLNNNSRNISFNANAVLPSVNYHICDRRTINDLFRFILIIDNAPTGRHDHFRSALKNRVVYAGWCSEEPITRGGIINHHCEFIFTHMNQTNLKEKMSQTGLTSSMDIANVRDVISRQLIELDNGVIEDRSYLTTPDYVIDTIDQFEDNRYSGYSDNPDHEEYPGKYDYDSYSRYQDDPHYNDGDHYCDDVGVIRYRDYETVQHNSGHFNDVSGPYTGTIDQLGSAVFSKSLYNSPRQSLNRVVSCMSRIINEPDEILEYGNDTSYSAMSDSSLIATKMRNILSDHPVQNVAGPNVNKTNTFSTLISMYPCIVDNITVIDIPSANTAYDIVDETYGNNIYNISMAMIKTSIPAILEDFGIVRITLRYASIDPRQNLFSREQRDHVIEVEGAEPLLINEDNEVFTQRVDMAVNAIIENVFNIVEAQAGDIEVMVDSTIGYDTLVQLQLCEHTDVIVKECGLHHGDLNGLITSSLSDEDTLRNHRYMMKDLVELIKSEKQGHL